MSASVAAPAFAETEKTNLPTVESLRGLSIEELTQVSVSSASKAPEPLGQAAAALYVITAEQIRRSPALSLAELLREAPNLQVQRIDARQYAISARGFNGYETANKLLARIDGRSIYSTLAAQIYWELHNPILEDLQQIEVVSGPGGTLYGPNAVNGVINIASKSALETLGGLARGTVGAGERSAALRYGVGVGDGALRIYGNYFDREGLPAGTGGDKDDDFSGVQGGFRMDLPLGANTFTLQGDIFDTNTDGAPGDGEHGRNLLARLSGPIGGAATFQVQGYYDQFGRDFTMVRDRLETFDLEGQANLTLGRHDLVLGAGARTTKDLFDNDLNPFILTPQSKRLYIFNAFAQDKIALTPRLDLIAGLKVEHSSFAGLELLPSIRIAWRPADDHLLWSAVSRAVRTPTRIDRDLNFLPLLARATEFESEQLTAIEAGYRGQPTPSTTLSVNVFYNLYDKLRSTELAPGDVLPIRLANGLEGNSYGIEAWATQQLAPWLRLRLGLATLAKDFEAKPGVTDIAGRPSTGRDSDYNLFVRSAIDLAPNVELDFGFRAIDSLDGLPRVDSFIEADARLGWRVTEGLELYVAGTNLLDKAHEEAGFVNASQHVERSTYAGTRLRF